MKLFIAMALFSFSLCAASWEKVTSNSGINVYRHKIDNLSIYRFKATAIIKATPERVFSILQNVHQIPEWVSGNKSVKLIWKNYTNNSYNMNITDFFQIFYGKNIIPWPFEDRDYILIGKIRYNKRYDVATLYLRTLWLAKFPPKKDITRMKRMDITFKLKPLKNDTQTLLYFNVLLDPGGFIPSWAVNLMIKNEPVKTIKRLRVLAKYAKRNIKMEKLIRFHLNKLRSKGKND